jgi:hypothetical protein
LPYQTTCQKRKIVRVAASAFSLAGGTAKIKYGSMSLNPRDLAAPEPDVPMT